MIVECLSLALLGLEHRTGWREALDSEEYSRAWGLAEIELDELSRSVAKAEILYRAGDPVGALAAAENGLQIDPTQLDLLFRATGAAVWLEQSALASDYAARLESSVNTSTLLDSSEAAAWRAAAAALGQRSAVLNGHVEEVRHAVERARLLTFGGTAFVLAFVALLARPRYGRSSNPVS